MGVTIKLACPHCKYVKKFEIGEGMMDYDLETVLPRFNRETLSLIYKWLESHEKVMHNAKIILSWCEKCGSYGTTQTLELVSAENEREFFCNRCLICGDELYEVDNEIECSRCGSDLELSLIGVWD